MTRFFPFIFLFFYSTASLACEVYLDPLNYRVYRTDYGDSLPKISLVNANDFSIPNSPQVSSRGDLTIYGAIGEIVSLNPGGENQVCVVAKTGQDYSVWEMNGVTRDVKFIQGNSGINKQFEIIAIEIATYFGRSEYLEFSRNLTIVGGNSPLAVLLGGIRFPYGDPKEAINSFYDVAGTLSISTRNFDDRIEIGLGDSKRFILKTGGGDDVVSTMDDYNSGLGYQFTSIDMGAGNDVFGIGGESEGIGAVYSGYMKVNMGSGDDVFSGAVGSAVQYPYDGEPIYFSGGIFSTNLSVNMGSGNDFSMYKSINYDAKSTIVHNDGSGDDRSTLGADVIRYNGGSGDDVLKVAKTTASSKFNGSAGDDILDTSPDSKGKVTNFENVFVNGEQQNTIVEITSTGDMVLDFYQQFSSDTPGQVDGPQKLTISSMPGGSISVNAEYCHTIASTVSCETLTQDIAAASLTRDVRINTNSTDMILVGVTIPRDLVVKTLKPLSGPYANADQHGMNLQLTSVNVGRNMTVRGQKYNDQVSIKASTFNGVAKIDTLQNSDDVAIVGSTFNRQFTYNASSGDDAACIQGSLFKHAVSTNLSSGNDDLTIIDSTKNTTVGRINLTGGIGVDVYYRHNAFRDGNISPGGKQFMVVSHADGEFENCRGY